jgi:hypothetical protein
MYIKQQYAERLFEVRNTKFKEKGIGNYVDMGYIDGFQELLNNIAKERRYTEGEKIIDSDLDRIKKAVKLTLTGMINIMAEQPLSLAQMEKIVGSGVMRQIESIPEDLKKMEAIFDIEKKGKLSEQERLNYDPYPAFVAVTDHMYAMAMRTLGCPDIPESFGDDVISVVKNAAVKAETSMKGVDYQKTSVKLRYDKQRQMDANEVKSKIKKNQKLIDGKKASPLNVAQYAAEYFALKKRQEGHGGIWRFFHKQENEDRMKLLETMEKSLKSLLNEGDELDKLTPVMIAESYNSSIVASRAKETFAFNGISKRNQIPHTFFEHKPTSTKRADEAKEKEKNEAQFDGEVRELLKFEKGVFKESEPLIDLDDSFFGIGDMVDDNEQEMDLSEIQSKNNPLAKL